MTLACGRHLGGAASADHSDQTLEYEDRIASGALDGGIRLCKQFDAPTEAAIVPALQVTASAIHLPGR